MIIKKIRKRFKDVPAYITSFRFLFGLRLLVIKLFRLPVLCKTKNGSWFFLGLDRLDEEILKYLNKTHVDVYFPPQAVIRSNDVIIDVGAHHGLYAIELTSRFPQVSVYSFEPDPHSFFFFRMNLRLNNRRKIQPINAALSNQSGDSFIVHSDAGSWGNFVTDRKEDGDFKIKTISVVDFIKKFGISEVAIIKLNAEGAEFVILPELFIHNIFPKRILLFAHPEKGDVEQLTSQIYARGYHCESSFESKTRPWYIFAL